MNGFRYFLAATCFAAGASIATPIDFTSKDFNTARAITPETLYFGLFANGQRIGTTSTKTSDVMWNGKPALFSDSLTKIDAELIGAALSLNLTSKTWTSPTGRPYQMRFKIASSGLTQDVEAVYEGSTVRIVVDNIGKKTTSRVPVPKEGLIIDDPLPLVAMGRIKPGESKSFWVFDPMTVAFLKNEIKYKGKEKIATAAGEVNADYVEIVDPRVTTKVYLTGKGDLIKAVSGLGIEIRPITKSDAERDPKAKPVDLASVTKIPVDDPIDGARTSKLVSLEVLGGDMSGVGSDEHQTVNKIVGGYRVNIHPTWIKPGAKIQDAATGDQRAWLSASLHIPAKSPKMVNLARRITGGTDDLAKAARLIHQYVNSNMRANAGMGVLRNAEQVLESGEGVCRDHAILTATLFRAAGIPARLAGGMIYADTESAFFYHAWAEIGDGTQWVGIDTTLPEIPISAVHLKLASGNVDRAFAFTFLAETKIKVVKSQTR
jgi:hypothetical protein